MAKIGKIINIKTIRPSYFLWVGGWEDHKDQEKIELLLKNKGLTGRVIFVGQVNNPLDFFAASDVFAMVSRDDPYPVVCLEAAAMGKPILCFSDAGGIPEFVEKDSGFIVPYLNVDEMAAKVILLSDDKVLLRKLGDRATEKVLERHDVSVGAKKILALIENLIR